MGGLGDGWVTVFFLDVDSLREALINSMGLTSDTRSRWTICHKNVMPVVKV